MQQTTWDVIIIGGGSAGLSAALMLGRSRRRVLVLDEGRPRNRFAAHMHGVLGRDHTSPLTLLADGRAELERYDGVELRNGVVVAASGSAPMLELQLADGTPLRTRRLLVASGLTDTLPELPGLAEQWGRSSFLCPYCDGWEVRDRRIAVLVRGAAQVHQAQLMRQLSEHVTVFAHGAGLSEDARAGLLARGIGIETRPVVAVNSDEAGSLRGILLDDGEEFACDAIFTAPQPEPNDGILQALGAVRAPHPMGGTFVSVDASGRTSVPGVWAAGNVTDPRSSVPYAMAAGSLAGASINADLVEEEVHTARRDAV